MHNIVNKKYSTNFPNITQKYMGVREEFESFLELDSSIIVDICVLAYNQLEERTKICVENILKHTRSINFHLILIDNGSTDGTMNYFKEVDYDNKTIIHIEKNTSPTFAETLITPYLKGKYYVRMGNDVIVTPAWLKNLLIAAESNSTYGMIIPCITNSAFDQIPNIPQFNTLEELEKIGLEYNRSNPLKWQERVALLPSLCLLRKTCLDAIGSIWDYALVGYCDIDTSFRIRRAGYKNILCKDTMIHHNHIYTVDNMNDDTLKSIDSDKFGEKYPGIHPWNDCVNFEEDMITCIREKKSDRELRVLGIDVKCGVPLLQIKNKLRENGTTKCKLSAFSTHAKYYTDLNTVCDEYVYSDRIEYIDEYFTEEYFDYILIGEELNYYNDPIAVLKKCVKMLKTGGELLVKSVYMPNINILLKLLGEKNIQGHDLMRDITHEEVLEVLDKEVTSVEIEGKLNPASEELMLGIEELTNRISLAGLSREQAKMWLVNTIIYHVKK